MAVEDVRALLRYLYADQIQLHYRSALESNCYGCITEHPSQTQHICLEPLDEFYIPQVYGEAETKVDKHYLKLLFIETCNTLWLNPNLVDFDNTLVEILQWWNATDFQDLETTLSATGDYFQTASAGAALKISSLEERFTK